MTMLYPLHKSIKIVILRRLWGTQKNIEAVEKWAQKKEELEKKIKRNSSAQNGQYKKGQGLKYLDFYSSICCYKYLFNFNYSISRTFS